MCVISYVVLTLGVAHILPFERGSIFAILLVIALVNIYILRKKVTDLSFQVSTRAKKLLFLPNQSKKVLPNTN
jgi:hypothetical protein